MKLLYVKANHFKNAKNNFEINFIAKSKKTAEDKEYELEPAEQGIYRGSIWSEDMMLRWGSGITDKKIIFCAKYSGGNDKISEYMITFDNRRLYWNIHRIQGS